MLMIRNIFSFNIRFKISSILKRSVIVKINDYTDIIDSSEEFFNKLNKGENLNTSQV